MPRSTRFFVTALLAFGLAIVPRAHAAGEKLWVILGAVQAPPVYPTLTAALQDAFSADTIIVMPGTYQECPTVSGLVLLKILGKKGAVIDATGCQAGLTINSGEGIVVKGLTIIGAKQGIVAKVQAARLLVSKTTIADPAVDPQLAALETGVQIQGAPAVTLDGVTIRGAKLYAVQALVTTDTLIRKSTFADGAGGGVHTVAAQNALVEKNVMQNLGGPGVAFGGIDSLVASNKILFTAGGIQVTGTNSLIEKNKITDCSTPIAALVSSSGSIYRKNTIVRGANAAILAGGSGDTFEKNTIKEPVVVGVDVAGSTNVFLGGKVSDAGTTGWYVRPGANGNVFQGSSSSKAAGTGFTVEGANNVFVKAKASKSLGIDLQDPAGGATTNTYTDCKFKTSSIP